MSPRTDKTQPGLNMRAESQLAPTIVVVAKRAVPGRVKTRLIGDLSSTSAARVHMFMLECVLARAATYIAINAKHHLVLALDQSDADVNTDVALDQSDGYAGWRTIDQGPGNLGARLTHIWQIIGDGPVVFVGGDSPDVPAKCLRLILPALEHADAAIGPAPDGGFWVLTARRFAPRLLQGIDWGSDRVYHQTHQAARCAGLALTDLETWFDVDTGDDLNALRHRLRESLRGPPDPALAKLSANLDQVC